MWFFMALLSLLLHANVAHSLRLEHSIDGGKSFILIGDVDMDPVRITMAYSWPDSTLGAVSTEIFIPFDAHAIVLLFIYLI